MKELSNLVSAGKDRKTRGRGGSRGGTSGRGGKGQTARSGWKSSPSFEGGQMPLTRRQPKRGFCNTRFEKKFEIINLDSLGKIAGVDVITREVLQQHGLIKHDKTLIKLLGNGSVATRIEIHVDACSKSAREALEAQGGKVHLTQES